MEDPKIEARRHLLDILPRILASLADVWKAINVVEETMNEGGKERPGSTMGQPKV